MSFHHPKKDLCLKCEQYRNASEEDKVKLIDEYNNHVQRKEQARSEKAADKERAMSDRRWHVVTADLQSVLSTPCSNVSSMYYARKLSVYNFTLYDQASHDGYCMLWNETIAQRGANEIGSLMYLYMKEYLPPNVKHVVITSDSTVAQNRNQHVTSMMLFAVQKLGSLETIEQKFLEVGHTEMEVDSIHSTIDSARKNLTVHIPDEWPVILKVARRRKPYTVREIEQADVYDLHKLSKEIGMKNVPVNWMKVKCIRVCKGVTDKIETKESYEDEYNSVLLQPTRRKTRNNQSSGCIPDITTMVLTQAYDNILPISVSKKKDLVKLCTTGAIPKKFHAFYNGLKTEETLPDCLPEPDCTENVEAMI